MAYLNKVQGFLRLSAVFLSHLAVNIALYYNFFNSLSLFQQTLNNTKFGFIAVSLAGCVTNILLAIIAMFLLQFQFIATHSIFSTTLITLARINIILGAFNLIPIPPLDGSKVLMKLLPDDAQNSFARIEPYGFFIIAFMLFTGMMYPLIDFMQNIIYGFISLLFGFYKWPHKTSQPSRDGRIPRKGPFLYLTPCGFFAFEPWLPPNKLI
jgi:Zn-dependent protease